MINESVQHVMSQMGCGEQRPVNELFLQGNKRNPRFWAAQGDTVWLAGSKGKLAQKVLANMEKKTGVELDGDEMEEIHDFTSELEERPDILFGTVDPEDDVLTVWKGRGLEIDSDIRHNILVHKVARALKKKYIRKARWGETTNFTPTKREHTLPDTLYHGTSWASLKGIMKTGLRPQKKGQFDDRGVKHDKHIFLTSNLEEAQGHADTAARNEVSLPVIVEFAIPDKNALVADYDIDVASDQSEDGYKSIRDANAHKGTSRKGTIPGKSFGNSRDVGIYGYRGAIPPKFIKGIHIAHGEDPSPRHDDYNSYSREQLVQAMREIEEHDLEEVAMGEMPEDMDGRLAVARDLMDEYWRQSVRPDEDDDDFDFEDGTYG